MIKKSKKLIGNWLLKNGKAYNPLKGQYIDGDILINNGIIVSIGVIKEHVENIIDCSGKVICPGVIDIHSHFREPGREDKETLESGSMSAMAGGYTKVCVMPNTNPPLDSPESIRYIIEKTESEDGVRNLRRSIECIISNLNLFRLMGKNIKNESLSISKLNIDFKIPFTINNKIIDYLLKNKKNMSDSIAHIYT